MMLRREIIHRRSSEGISIGYFAVLLVGFLLWIAYGAASRDLPLVIPNCLAFVVMTITITIALRARPGKRSSDEPSRG